MKVLKNNKPVNIFLFEGFWTSRTYTNFIRKHGEKQMLDYYKEKLEARKQKWWQWHKKNPQVYEKFVEYTFDAINSGRKHYSHWAIVNRIRWNREIETKGSEFKISNDYICFYARLFHAHYPKHDGFFRLKPLKEEKSMQDIESRSYNNVRKIY